MSVWFGELRTLSRRFLKRRDVQAGNGHTAAVIQPHDNSASLWIHRSVLRTRDRVAIPTARQNEEWFKRAGCQQLTNI